MDRITYRWVNADFRTPSWEELIGFLPSSVLGFCRHFPELLVEIAEQEVELLIIEVWLSVVTKA